MNPPMTLLIYPPAAKPCEPSAGLARLAGALRRHDRPSHVWDANVEALLWLAGLPPQATDRWTSQARRRREQDLLALQSPHGYQSSAIHATAVRNLNRLLMMQGIPSQSRISLADFQHASLSPLRSHDLIAAAASPETSVFYPFYKEKLDDLIDRLQPGRIGISLNYLSQALPAFALLGLLRRDYPGITVLLGGGLITSWMRRRNWHNPFTGLADVLVDGPGERPLLRLTGIDDSAEGPYPPDFSDLPWNAYLAPGKIMPYNASRGCFWNRCAFCPEVSEGHTYMPVRAQQVLSELKQLVKLHQPALIHFTDNALSPALLRALIAAPPGVPWYGFVRISPQLADIDFCRGLRQAGCRMLKIGLESGDDAVLEGMQKGANTDLAGRALQCLARAGIATYIYLLFGTPWEDEAAAQRTLDFTVKHHNAITFINPAIFNLPLDAAAESGLETHDFYQADLQLYSNFKHPLRWNRTAVRHFLDRRFKRVAVIAAILRRTPPSFTSNHAAFFAPLYLYNANPDAEII